MALSRKPPLASSDAPAPLSRRTVLTAGLAAGALGCAGRETRPAEGQRFDVLVQGGTVYDGTGAPGVLADVGIVDGRIAAVGALAGAVAREQIDARGLAVAPGFIDLHSHADGTLFDDPNAESVLRQGVTTVVVGQDGSSRAPRHFQRMGAFFDAVDALPPAVNVASTVGLGSVRETVVGMANRPATSEELTGTARGGAQRGRNPGPHG